MTTLTVHSILKDKPVSINSICKQGEIQKNDIRAALIKIITSGAKLLAEYKRPTPDMVIWVCNLITDQYSHLSIDGVTLCMTNLYTGKYGEIIALDIERYGKALNTFSEELRTAAVSYNPAPSNKFPRERDRKRPCKMPEHVRELLKKDIGYVYQKQEEIKPVKRDWKKELPDLTDEEVIIYEYFDEMWKEQHCRLDMSKPPNQIVEVNGKEMTRGAFVLYAKKEIEKSRSKQSK